MICMKKKTSPAGFTLVEMLVAMAVTLLMMAALARSFGFIGDAVRDSRGNVALSSQLLDASTLISSELDRCTVTLEPVIDGEEPPGYLLYSEGPVTDVTSSLFNAGVNADGELVLNDARYGDFDDYLAFTAVAEDGNWFTGKVPRFVLDLKTAELRSDLTYPNDFPGNPLDPVVIRSKYAEIVYFASPEYVDGTLTNDPTINPAFVDTDGDGSGNRLPDRIQLHRRVLLIRPDLNLNNGSLPARTFNENGDTNPGTNYNWFQADPFNASTIAQALYSMAAVHQQCDLSLRRVDQTQNVAANSLADLSRPHNRFAHVRLPGSLVGIAGTTMPLLALGTSQPILANTIAPPLAPVAGETVVTPNVLSGFLRPEFILGNDRTHFPFGNAGLNANSQYGLNWLNRKGEDVLTNNALSFDVQIYDPEVSLFTTSSNLVVGPNDAGYRQALSERIIDQSSSPPVVRQLSQGGFVDLAYPVLAGGSLRGWQARNVDNLSAGPLALSFNIDTRQLLDTPFSGVQSSNIFRLSNTLTRSGRLVSASNQVRIFQPAFDTYTRDYETDGIRQSSGTWIGTQIGTQSPDDPEVVDLGADGLDGDGRFGADDLGEHETTPPFTTKADAIKVTIRIENPSTRQVRQTSVVHRD